MCCLAYENKTYEEILKRMPKVNSKIQSPKGEGTVVYNDILRERVSVKVQSGDDSFTIYDFTLAELAGEKPEEEQEQKQPKENKPPKTFLEEKPANVKENDKARTEKPRKEENKQNNQNSKTNNNINGGEKPQNQNKEQSENKKPNKKRHWHFGKK